MSEYGVYMGCWIGVFGDYCLVDWWLILMILIRRRRKGGDQLKLKSVNDN